MEEEKIHSVFGDWQVFESGDMFNVKTQHSITYDRLEEGDFVVNSIGWGWDLNTFFPAYWQACELANLTEITLKITHNG